MLRNKVGLAGRGLGMCSVGTEYASRRHLRNAHYMRNVNNYMHVREKHGDSTVPNTPWISQGTSRKARFILWDPTALISLSSYIKKKKPQKYFGISGTKALRLMMEKGL